MFVVQLEKGAFGQECFLADWPGDPGRTLVIENAKRYQSIRTATYTLAYARKYGDFPNAQIKDAEQGVQVDAKATT